MLHSRDRILTTHTGSLPRPGALGRAYMRRAAGENVDAAALERMGWDATVEAVRHRSRAGLDIGNNGEQQREAFFLYVRHRMSGSAAPGPEGHCGMSRGIRRVPRLGWQRTEGPESPVGNAGLPQNVGEVRYMDAALVEAGMRRLPRARWIWSKARSPSRS